VQPSRNDSDEAFLNQYEVDRRSIFIGGLPAHATENELKDLFAEAGQVLDIQLVKKSTASNGMCARGSRLHLSVADFASL